MLPIGVPDDAYRTILDGLGRDELLGKLVMIPGSNELDPGLQDLAVPSVNMDGLFIRGGGVAASPHARPLLIASSSTPNGIPRIGSASSLSTTLGGGPSPESEINSQATLQSVVLMPTVTPGQPIDPSKVRLYRSEYGPFLGTSNTLRVTP